MARLTLELEEVIRILVAHDLLPGEVVNPTAKGDKIHFMIKVDSFMVPRIPASLEYVRLEGNDMIFHLTVISSRFNSVLGRLKRAFHLHVPEWIRLDLPKVLVDTEKLLMEKNIQGVTVEEVTVKDGELTVITSSA